MAQSDCRDESSHCLKSSVVANPPSSFEKSNPANILISQIMKTKLRLPSGFSLETGAGQDTGGLQGTSGDSLNQLEGRSLPDMSAALKSMDLTLTWDLKKIHCAPVHELLSVPTPEKDSPTLPPLADQDKSTERAAGPAKKEVPSGYFRSKYICFFPLYQDYCLQAVKDDLHRLKDSSVAELITSQYVQGLQSRCYARAPWLLSSPPVATLSPPPHPIRVVPRTLWQDLDEVKASGLLSSLTTREIRLQESMFELIGSEASYLRSLGVAVDHFYASTPLKRTLSQREHHILFSNIHQLMAASEKFLMDLEIRLGECALISQVGDVVLQHCPEFHSLYVPYVTNMKYQEALVNQLLQQNRNFLSSVRKLESDPVCRRQSLKSFLVLPFQRITRIKLILESILKLTEPDSHSILNLKRAIEAIHEIVMECDKRVRKMKQIEELLCLKMLLDFGKVKMGIHSDFSSMQSFPLVVSGRFLVHQGPVRQLTVEAAHSSRLSFISVYLHLFNDLLIISSKKDQRFTVVDYAEFPEHVHLGHLKTEALGLPTDSFLLHLSRSQTRQPTAMILVTHTRSDKEAWMKALSSKQ